MEQEWKIGEIKQVNGEWYQCIESHSSCEGCDFKNASECSHAGTKCSFPVRQDHTSVIFKKLEKIGEPIEYNGSFHQGYKAIDTAIDVCKFCVFSKISCGDAVICDKGVFYIKIKQSQENMEEKKIQHYDCFFDKKKLKPFNLQKAKEGKSVYTRDGREARVICFDREFIHKGKNYCIVALINDGSHGESLYSYTEDGLFSSNKIHNSDLMMLPEKKEGWINVYTLNTCYSSKEEAEANIDQDYESEYIRTVKINWEE